MSSFYGPTHRDYQDAHGTRRLADRLEALAHAELTPDERAFIESRTLFFLSTVDHQGWPTVSYKGGPPGFVRVLDDARLVFPSYDGNGMFLTLGNIAANPQVGMLFIDFDTPRRLRLQGLAQAGRDPALLAHYPGAQYAIEVRPTAAFVNCGRYIHRAGTLSPHIPDAEGHQPFPDWKRLDFFSDTLTDEDRRKVEAAGGTLPIEAYSGEDGAGQDPGEDKGKS